MPPETRPTEAKPKSTETQEQRLTRVRAYMARVYGHCLCIRKGCEELIGAASGYCAQHHTEWINSEYARNYILPKEVVERRVVQNHGTCSWKDCRELRDRKDSGYCKKHRAQYMKNYYKKAKSA